MLVLVTFFSIGVMAVLFLLRFFMALESEVKASRKRTPAILEVASRRRAASFPITLVHSRSRLALRPNLAISMNLRREQKPQAKGA
jgi:hypothetical protein